MWTESDSLKLLPVWSCFGLIRRLLADVARNIGRVFEHHFDSDQMTPIPIAMGWSSPGSMLAQRPPCDSLRTLMHYSRRSGVPCEALRKPLLALRRDKR